LLVLLQDLAKSFLRMIAICFVFTSSHGWSSFWLKTKIAKKTWVLTTYHICIPPTDVWHKTISKRFSWKKKGKKKYWYLSKLINCWKNQTPLGYYNKYTIQKVYFAYLSLQTVEIIENQIWNCQTSFSKINKYSANKRQIIKS
jgi:hypothetical protein